VAVPTERHQGTLASWNRERGFGFIAPNGGGTQIFIHVRAFPYGMDIPPLGSRLSYEVEVTADGKTRSRYVRVEGPPVIRARTAMRASILGFVPIPLFVVIYIVDAVFWHPPYWVLFVYLGTSLLCIVIYRIDKLAAAQGRWRVSESALLLLGLAGGWPGAIIAQQLLRHKTKKRSFQEAFAGSVVVNILVFVLLTSPILGWLTPVSVGS
jgi:uncharacterized membrane protein YsdA (DUF1294 family)/cold shock CspA family protein